MCYDIEAGYKNRIKAGIRMGASTDDINYHIELYNKRFPETPLPLMAGGFHLSGFAHPTVPIFVFSEETGLALRPMQWGLIPQWCKDAKEATKLWNQTLNARSESMYEKPSFRMAATQKRGIVLLQSFYEHHHFGKRTYPFNIRLKSDQPMFVAVLWEEWIDKATGECIPTFSIVTVKGNQLMSALHNNPKLEGARMPLILENEAIDHWLMGNGPEMKQQIQNLCVPFHSEKMKAHPVRPLRGKAAVGDVHKAIEPFDYPELQFDTELMEVLRS
ncbi:MAG: SOS response-associated peptidase [Flavobacteriales bacterium]|nr:SOS response-associated peptidase [Flavobacteriales bacterium]